MLDAKACFESKMLLHLTQSILTSLSHASPAKSKSKLHSIIGRMAGLRCQYLHLLLCNLLTQVVLCGNHLPSATAVKGALAHELIHAYDYCRTSSMRTAPSHRSQAPASTGRISITTLALRHRHRIAGAVGAHWPVCRSEPRASVVSARG